MARVQLALNVSDLTSAVEFYTKLFRAAPSKVHPGYANFVVEDPPLKLVLVEGAGVGGTVNHLGVEVPTTDDVTETTQRLSGEGLDTAVEENTTCCWAVQDKVWVHDPDDRPWEVYTVIEDASIEHDVAGTACCQT